jgi:hypothetical protein
VFAEVASVRRCWYMKSRNESFHTRERPMYIHEGNVQGDGCGLFRYWYSLSSSSLQACYEVKPSSTHVHPRPSIRLTTINTTNTY